MLDLRPSCEQCDRDLPPDSRLAMICSFECTFCADCVQSILENVCPNCGGGFQLRPVRPARKHKGSAHLGERPASKKRIHKPRTREELQPFIESLKGIDPYSR